MLYTHARWELFLKSISDEKNRVMVKSERTVHTNRHCIVGESVFSMRKWISIIRVSKDDMDELTVGEDDGVIIDESVGGSKLELPEVSVEPSKESQERQARESPMQVGQEQEPGNEDTGEMFTTREHELRRSTRVERTPQRFEHFAPAASRT